MEASEWKPNKRKHCRSGKIVIINTNHKMEIFSNIIDIPNEAIFYGKVTIEKGKITDIEPAEGKSDHYLLPGFIDAHIHLSLIHISEPTRPY